MGAALLSLALGVGCSGETRLPTEEHPPKPEVCDFELPVAAAPALSGDLRINEVMTGNDGAWVDEVGETDDFIELVNIGQRALDLGEYALSDKSGKATRLPKLTLGPGRTALFWADDTPEQGPLHLPFKLSNSGARVALWSASCELADLVNVPELPRSESYARLPDGTGEPSICRYATPERENGETCGPPDPPNLDDSIRFAPFQWPEPFPAIAGPLVISELSLRPAGFVEVLNASGAPVALDGFALRLAALSPGQAPPGADAGVLLAWPDASVTLAPGERVSVPVGASETAELEASPDFEGVATLWREDSPEPSDRIDFMAWPEGASLARVPDATGAPRFCAAASPGAANEGCAQLPGRELASGRAHRLETAADFAELAEGGTAVGELGVKFVVDMAANDTVHLLSTRKWALHYTFVREQIRKEPHLDRCDPAQAAEFNVGWGVFSQTEYFRSEGRRYLLGTLVEHTNGAKTVEFSPGDQIVGEQMRRAFFAAMKAVPDPEAWAIRPTEGRQILELRAIEGTAPIVGPNAPYKGLTYQSLNPAEGFGTLTFVPARDLETAELGPNVIVVTDDVPNETAFMGGLITEAFQTPLAHVNVLARGRGTPNMALRGARDDARLKALFGKLVRLEVRASDFDIREATAQEADAYWEKRKPTGARLSPALDRSVRGIVPLDAAGYAMGDSIGSKAAGMAELYRVSGVGQYCPLDLLPLYVPPAAFAIPFSHYMDHFEASGAAELLAELEQDPEFRADPHAHAEGLAEVRARMLAHPVDPAILSEVTGAIEQRFGGDRVRLRSSSNTEDLATFNGAGLHTSTSGDLDAESSSIEDALRTVWASLWNTRAYDEREFGHVEQARAAMAVLVHQAWQSERAQGVAISRNALDATRDSQYYINAQIGEASVTNPAPGVTSDEIVYTPPPRTIKAEYHTRSSLSRGRDVLSFPEVQRLGCVLESVHAHYRPLVDPKGENRLYAMQIEWKLIGPERRLLVKQARPYSFGTLEAPGDCREY
ncbi:PEP/pyruvate-binding domain-containing protein [Sorangium cellulosum]|uniref:PEP/pyruvate-binding domain-containing protein n=1 Tax=Sorangium cellulosum TaxID=56 RepID=UPI001E64B691|nr:PEP/pyruvate-binding domain-containing protein [Sorangium cellulosum]